jgi:hypothetical protein
MPIQQFGTGEQSFIVRLRTNIYTMLANDVVSIEYPSNATDGLEISTNSVQTLLVTLPELTTVAPGPLVRIL